MCFCVKDFKVSVYDYIFSGNKQQMMYTESLDHEVLIAKYLLFKVMKFDVF